MNVISSASIFHQILQANERIHAYIRQTPVDYSFYLSQETNSDVYLKLENVQLTGSFKIRGALNKILALGQRASQTKLITASSGNHGAAFAWCIHRFSLQGEIFLPRTVPEPKINHLRLFQIPLKLVGDDCVQAEIKAKETAIQNGNIFISPYNDEDIIAGQGTIGLELAEQIQNLDAVIVPVGGGGLISGIASYLKHRFPSIKIIGCQPENSAVMYHSLKAGKILDLPSEPTVSDGTAGGIEPGAITFTLCQELVDEMVLLREDEILQAIKLLIERHHLLVEGAGALSVAALLKNKNRFQGQSIALILSGARLSTEVLQKSFSF